MNELQILDLLSSQRFADWYNTGKFDAYITGGEMPDETPSKATILADIKKMFLIK
jgi:hypothetical protein